jgi:ATP-dependent exoDNAse (exonuclease V) alpha subunit
MMDTPRADRLVQLCDGAIVRTIGDRRQAEAIGAGGWYAAIDGRIGHAELRNVHRQRNTEDLEVCKLVRLGQANQALENLKARGRLHVEATEADAVGQLLDDWERHRSDGLAPKDVLVITDMSNDLIDHLNELIQYRRMRAGELSEVGITVAEAASGRQETFHVGDRVCWIEGARCGNEIIRNGAAGTVSQADGERHSIIVDLDVSRGEMPHRVRVSLDAYAERQALRLGYASHAQKTQGAEAKVALILPGNRNTDGHSGYSMITRPEDQIHVYASKELHGFDPIQTIGRRWSEIGDKRAAITYSDDLSEMAPRREMTEKRSLAEHLRAQLRQATHREVGKPEPLSHSRQVRRPHQGPEMDSDEAHRKRRLSLRITRHPEP